MKYVIDIPDNAGWIEYYYPINEENARFKGAAISIDLLEPYTEPDRKAIEDEVWEFVCELVWSFGDKEILGMGIDHAVRDMTYQEAKAKYEEWKKQKDEIRVGDEVEYFCGGNIRFVVCGIDNGTAYGFKYRPDFEDLDIGEYCDIDELKKTGRHFPEVAELLKKMRGGEYE